MSTCKFCGSPLIIELPNGMMGCWRCEAVYEADVATCFRCGGDLDSKENCTNRDCSECPRFGEDEPL